VDAGLTQLARSVVADRQAVRVPASVAGVAEQLQRNLVDDRQAELGHDRDQRADLRGPDQHQSQLQLGSQGQRPTQLARTTGVDPQLASQERIGQGGQVRVQRRTLAGRELFTGLLVAQGLDELLAQLGGEGQARAGSLRASGFDRDVRRGGQRDLDRGRRQQRPFAQLGAQVADSDQDTLAGLSGQLDHRAAARDQSPTTGVQEGCGDSGGQQRLVLGVGVEAVHGQEARAQRRRVSAARSQLELGGDEARDDGGVASVDHGEPGGQAALVGEDLGDLPVLDEDQARLVDHARVGVDLAGTEDVGPAHVVGVVSPRRAKRQRGEQEPDQEALGAHSPPPSGSLPSWSLPPWPPSPGPSSASGSASSSIGCGCTSPSAAVAPLSSPSRSLRSSKSLSRS